MLKKLLNSISKNKAVILSLLLLPSLGIGAINNSGCSDAGVASSTGDSICYNETVNLVLAGYTGTIIQWQSFDGSSWIDETGTGSNTDNYPVTLLNSTDFRAIVTQTGCPSDTSNSVTVTVGTIPVPSAINVSRCGPGYVTLSGIGAGTLQWFTNQSGGTPFDTGSTVSTFVPGTTTLYVGDNVLGGSGTNSPLLITELDLGNTDYLELQNVSPLPVDVTGWKLAINDSYNDITIVNANIQTLSGTLQPGDIITYTDNTLGPNYWGSNILWNPGAFPTFTGWVLLLDAQNNIKDFIALNWPDANIQAMSVNIQGAFVSPGSKWSGDGIDISAVAATTGVSRAGNSDNDNNSDFTVANLNIGTTNPTMTIPFTGYGCSSPRIPVVVTINPSDPVTITASTTALCLNGTSQLDVTSNNPNYTYTWSPATGLNTTTGSSVIATPLVTTTYVVLGDDGTCSNVDTVTISVGAPTVPGIASTVQDTICIGKNTDLVLTGSTGDIQWQSLNGATWVNETGPGNNTATYNVAPIANTTYRAYVSSGSCPPDSSNILDIVVLSISNPTTSDTTICNSGTVTLNASGQGALSWYTTPTGGTPVYTGNAYTFSANATTTYYVEAFGGTSYHIGPLNSGFGNQTSSASVDYGMAFDVIRPINLDVVYVYPAQSGLLTINLRQTQGGPILATYSQQVTAFTGKVPVYVAFSIPVGTNYRLEIASGSPQCQLNTSGAVYPYTIPNGPLAITGYLSPTFGTFGSYYYLYDWEVSEGCRSQRIPSTVTVNPLPPTPTITQNFNVLTSSSATGNQWLFNGSILPGETNQTLTISQLGVYSVAVTVNGCTSISANFNVVFIGIDEIPGSTFSLYPNPANKELTIVNTGNNSRIKGYAIYDIAGRLVLHSTVTFNKSQSISINISSLNAGYYSIELSGDEYLGRKSFVIER